MKKLRQLHLRSHPHSRPRLPRHPRRPTLLLDEVDAIGRATGETEIEHEIAVYPGADHGFFCDQRDSYQEEAARDAWERVKALFASELAAS